MPELEDWDILAQVLYPGSRDGIQTPRRFDIGLNLSEMSTVPSKRISASKTVCALNLIRIHPDIDQIAIQVARDLVHGVEPDSPPKFSHGVLSILKLLACD